MITLKRLNEDSQQELKGEKIKFLDKIFTITKAEIADDVEDSIFYLEDDKGNKKIMSFIAFLKGTASTENKYINSLIDSVKVDKQEAEKQASEKETKPEVSERDRAIEDAQADFFAKPQKNDYFKKLDKEKYGIFSEYEEAYYNEFLKLKKSARKNRERRAEQTIDNTYDGDIDELIAWLRDAINSIDIESGDSTLNSAQEIARDFNKDYEVRLVPSKYAMQFTARLTDKQDILDKMPKEVKTWKAHKNIGKLKQYSDENVYNEKENSLTSNDIVFDLLNAYNFKLGKQEN